MSYSAQQIEKVIGIIAAKIFDENPHLNQKIKTWFVKKLKDIIEAQVKVNPEEIKISASALAFAEFFAACTAQKISYDSKLAFALIREEVPQKPSVAMDNSELAPKRPYEDLVKKFLSLNLEFETIKQRQRDGQSLLQTQNNASDHQVSYIADYSPQCGLETLIPQNNDTPYKPKLPTSNV